MHPQLFRRTARFRRLTACLGKAFGDVFLGNYSPTLFAEAISKQRVNPIANPLLELIQGAIGIRGKAWILHYRGHPGGPPWRWTGSSTSNALESATKQTGD
ncbi:MAG: hypothetical protein WD894_08050 [Pirellulales bacterium]